MVQALPSNIGIQQVTLKVADLDKMVNFYTKTIGLKLLKQGEGRAWLAPQGTNDAILVLKELTAGEENQGTTGLYHIAFLLPTRKDLGNMLLWLLQENVQIGAADHGYSEALYLSDPENNGIEIYWDKPEEVWDIRPNGEIIGVTEELDGDSLAAEADGHWLGISEGSKIGHIHLKVADLDATETFYKNLGFGLKSNFGQQAKFLQRSVPSSYWDKYMERQTAANDSRKSIWLRKLHLPFTNCGRFRDSPSQCGRSKVTFYCQRSFTCVRRS